MEGKYYLYRWIREDKNEPFYIGIGTKTNDNLKYGTYTRSYSKKKNNIIWEKIIRKTNWRIEIMLESDDYEFIKQKEIEFIALYGRIDKGTGCLANMTDGGEGTLGVIVSERARQLRSSYQKGRKKKKESILKMLETRKIRMYSLPKESRRKISLSKSKPVMQFSLAGELIKSWENAIIASEQTNTKRYIIGNAANPKNLKSFTGHNYIWIYKDDFENNNLGKFNLAIERAKIGKIKFFISTETKNKIREEFIKLSDINLRGKKIEKLSQLYRINYSTIRGIVYDL